MDDEPWDGYDRDRTWSGWSYPIGRSSVEAALRAAGVRLLTLGFNQPAGGDPDVVYLLQADRYADLGATYHLRRGTANRRRNALALYAVPGAVRPQATAALTTGGALQRACAWLADAEDADPTWLDKSHTWAVYLHHGALHWQQTEH